MKLFSGKCPFFIGGTLLAAALVFGAGIFGARAGVFDAFVGAGNCVKNFLADSWWCEKPDFDGQFALLLGIFVGALLVALVSGNFRFKGDGGIFFALIGGLAGGFLVMTGILVSGDTLWGHLTGCALLSAGSWVFLAAALGAAVFLSVLFAGASSGGTARETEKSAAKTGKDSRK
ncbi:MAG: YeeE/YedE family protein [Victivallaceae bacterium]|nr:YeeE/YedE family protein [Victivallaceae bacterium]